MATIKEARHAAILNLEKGSFQAEHGHTDITSLVHAVYQHAEAEGILGVVIMERDLEPFNMARTATRQEMAEPGAQATQTQMKFFETQRRLLDTQHKSIRELKLKLTLALDKTATVVVQEPLYGVLRRTALQILTLLVTNYSNMTNMELENYQTMWRTAIWDASTDLGLFMAEFMEAVRFLAQHNYAPPVGQQVMTLMAAVRHEGLFADMANPAFYNKHPTVAAQTLEHLIACYTEVYRGRYVQASASQYQQAANQAKHTTSSEEDEEDATTAGIIASARGSLVNTTVTHAQRMAIQDAVAKAITKCLQPERPREQTPAAQHQRAIPGVCTSKEHKGKSTHLWKDCRLNPANK